MILIEKSKYKELNKIINGNAKYEKYDDDDDDDDYV